MSLISLILLTQVALADQTKIAATQIPSADIGGEQAQTLQVEFHCIRAASFWEQLNNGLDPFTRCSEFTVKPTSLSKDDVYIHAKEDGSFDVPAMALNYKSGKYFYNAYACISLKPVELRDMIDGSKKYVSMLKSYDNKYLFCNLQAPEKSYLTKYYTEKNFFFNDFSTEVSAGLSW